MSWLSLLDPSLLIIFTLVLSRMAGLLVTAPIYGGTDIPPQARILLAVALAMLITPSQLARAVAPPQTLVDLLIVMVGEAMIGLILGLGILILLSGLQLAGQIISQLGGNSIGEVFNPQLDANVPLFAQVFNYFALAIFAIVGGHRIMMAALLDTFVAMPPGAATFDDSLVEICSTLVTQSLVLGIQISAPATAVLLLTNIVLGIISRTLPQLNVLSFGFGFNALITFGMLWLSLGGLGDIFLTHWQQTLDTLLGQ